jgi:hypothetical protein
MNQQYNALPKKPREKAKSLAAPKACSSHLCEASEILRAAQNRGAKAFSLKMDIRRPRPRIGEVKFPSSIQGNEAEGRWKEPQKPHYVIESCHSFHKPKIIKVCACNDWVRCPVCRKKRNKRNGQKIKNYLLAMSQDLKRFESLKFLTLTMKKGDLAFGDAREKILSSFKKLRRRKAWKSKVSYYIATLEVVSGNIHLHIALSGKFWAQAEISEIWHKVTGDSMIVDIRKIDSIVKASKELAKYMAKDTEPDVLSDLAAFRDANKKLRYMVSGRRPPSLDTIAITERPTCSVCSESIGHHGCFDTQAEAEAFLLVKNLSLSDQVFCLK